MIKTIVKSLFSLACILTAIAGLLTSHLGLHLTFNLISKTIPGNLQYSDIKGTLLKTITLDNVRYHNNNINLQAKSLSFKFNLLPLLEKKIQITQLNADKTHITVNDTSSGPSTPPLIAPLSFPWSLIINKLNFKNTAIKYTNTLYLPAITGHVLLSNTTLKNNININTAHLGNGTISLSGSTTKYQLQAQWTHHSDKANLIGTGNKDHFHFQGSMLLQSHHAKLKGNVHFPSSSASIQATFSKLNLHRLIPNAPLSLSGNINAKANLKSNTLDLTSTLTTRHDSIDIKINHHLKQWRGTWHVTAPHSHEISPLLIGSFTSEGSYNYDHNILNSNGNLILNQAHYHSNYAQKMELHWSIVNNAQQPSSLELKAKSIRFHHIHFDKNHLAIKGTQSNHQLTVLSTIHSIPVQIQTHGQASWNHVLETITQLTVSPDNKNPLTLTKTATLSYQHHRLSLSSICLKNKNNLLCTQGEINANHNWLASLHVDTSDLHSLSQSLSPSTLLGGKMKLSIKATGHHNTVQTANVTGELNHGYIHHSFSGYPISIPLFHTNVNAALTPDKATLKINATLSPLNSFSTALNMTPYNKSKSLIKQLREDPTQGSISVNFNQLKPLLKLNPNLPLSSGKLLGKLQFKGSLNKPTLTGKINFTPTKLMIPFTGTVINKMDSTVSIKHNYLHTKTTLFNNNHTINFVSSTQLASPYTTQSHVNLDNYPLLNTPEYRASITSSLDIALNSNGAKVTGKIFIPQASIKPALTQGIIKVPSQDIIYSSQAHSHSQPFPIKADIQAELGKKVTLNTMGITGQLQGKLRITGSLPDQLTANGNVHIQNGVIHTYSHILHIHPSSGLSFYNSIVTDPNINLAASRIINTANSSDSAAIVTKQITVGLKLTGKLKHPHISMYSSPASLTQSEILSYLVLGTNTTLSSQSVSHNLVSALTALELTDSGISGAHNESLTNKIINTLGFSELGAASQVNKDALGNNLDNKNESSLVIGKYFTKHIYVRYTPHNNLLQIKLILNPSWSIQASSSTLGNGLDLLYNVNS